MARPSRTWSRRSCGATPDWSALPADTPPAVTRLVRRCLERDPKARVHDIGDARLEIEDAEKALDAGERAVDATAQARWRHPTRSIAALLDWEPQRFWLWQRSLPARVCPGLATRTCRGPARARLEMRPPERHPFRRACQPLSPDGRQIAFVTAPDAGGPSRLLWSVRSPPTRRDMLPGTNDAELCVLVSGQPLVAFFAKGAGKLKRLKATGGRASNRDLQRALLDVVVCGWTIGSIVFAPSQYVALMRVGAGGGEPTPFTKLRERRNGSPVPTASAGWSAPVPSR